MGSGVTCQRIAAVNDEYGPFPSSSAAARRAVRVAWQLVRSDRKRVEHRFRLLTCQVLQDRGLNLLKSQGIEVLLGNVASEVTKDEVRPQMPFFMAARLPPSPCVLVLAAPRSAPQRNRLSPPAQFVWSRSTAAVLDAGPRDKSGFPLAFLPAFAG